MLALIEVLQAEVDALKHDIARHMEIANTAEARAEKMREALVKLSGFYYPTAEKVAIARAALDGDK